MVECILVGIGGFIGTICRYLIGRIPLREEYLFPMKTFFINLVGSCLMGIIAALAVKHSSLSPKMVLFLKVGLCGGFTTFSSFALETGDLIENGHIGIAALYVISSVVVGVLAVLVSEVLIK